MRRLSLTSVALAVVAGCAGPELSYSIARGEFDSVTAFPVAGEDEGGFAFRAEVERWPWTVRLFYGSGFDWLLAQIFALEPSARPADNPSWLARDRLVEMTEYRTQSLGHLADVAARALWLAARDPQPLDQVVAIECLERVLADLGIDPLTSALAESGGEATLAAIASDFAALEAGAPWRRGGRLPTALETRLTAAALQRLTARPHPSAEMGRRLLRFLHRAAAAETEPVWRANYVAALVAVVGLEGARMLRIKLSASDEGVQRDEVRRAAILALLRLSGPRAVPFCVHHLVRSGAGSIDSSERIRRFVVRLCASLPREFVDLRVGEGPSPVEFLYDVVKDEKEQAGIRAVALEALAICLDRDTSHDPAWADAWWQERALQGARRSP